MYSKITLAFIRKAHNVVHGLWTTKPRMGLGEYEERVESWVILEECFDFKFV